jgi:hypothetical protein
MADIWTADVTTRGIEVLISAGANEFFARSEMPTTVPANYLVRGLGYFNRSDSNADILMEATSASSYPGLLRIDYTGDMGGTSNAFTLFPALLDVTREEHVVGVGDYDGINQEDVLTRLARPYNMVNEGALTVRLMNGSGDDVAGIAASLPQIQNFDFEVVQRIP